MSHSIAELAAALQAVPVGQTGIRVTGAAEPASAGPDQIAIAMDERYAAALSRGKARAAVMWQDADWQAHGLQAAILVTRPRLAMARLTARLAGAGKAPAGLHPTAIVGAGTALGDDVGIGAYSVIGPGAVIGAGARIGAHCTIAAGVSIGPGAHLASGVHIATGVRIGSDFIAHSGVTLGADGFSFVTAEPSAVETARATMGRATAGDEAQAAQPWIKIHSLGGVEIGDAVEIGANSNVDAGTIRPTRIGTGTKIDALVQVGHNVTIGRHCLLCAHVAVGGSSVIGDQVVLGGQVGVGDNLTVGAGVIAGGGSKILSNVPAGRAILGYPAVRMQSHIESYRALRRLPRILSALARGAQSGSDRDDSDE